MLPELLETMNKMIWTTQELRQVLLTLGKTWRYEQVKHFMRRLVDFGICKEIRIKRRVYFVRSDVELPPIIRIHVKKPKWHPRPRYLVIRV